MWIVTDAEFEGPLAVGRAVFVKSETAEAAAAEGMWMIWADYAENPGASPPTDAYVVDLETGTCERYRATVGAERVPDEFQCCGGMPSIATMGTTDEHTAICTAVRR